MTEGKSRPRPPARRRGPSRPTSPCRARRGCFAARLLRGLRHHVPGRRSRPGHPFPRPRGRRRRRLGAALQVLQPPGAGEGDLRCLSEDRVPHGAAGGRQAHLPQRLLLLQALPRQAEPGQLRGPARGVLLQAPLPAAVQEQGQLRRGLRPEAAQGALGAQGGGPGPQDGLMRPLAVGPPPRVVRLEGGGGWVGGTGWEGDEAASLRPRVPSGLHPTSLPSPRGRGWGAGLAAGSRLLPAHLGPRPRGGPRASFPT